MAESDALLTALLALHPKRIDLSLERMHRLLAALDHPEQKSPPIIHIAGTNGKGSTLAFLRAMLVANGHKIHAYTSPHLVRFHERIQLNGQIIEEARLADCLTRCQQANKDAAITFFEITTAAAFLAFAETPADYLLLEVGLGGRLDATNVMTPKLTAITPISLDHMEFLGNDIATIAAEKAGIIKPGVPVVSAPQHAEAARVIEAHAYDLQAPLFIGGQDWLSFAENERLIFQHTDGLLDLPMPALVGAHQFVNAGTALALARLLNLPERAMAEGLVQARWPARLQKLTRNLTGGRIATACPNADIWLDGGHNVAAARALTDWLNAHPDQRPTELVLGMLNTKAHEDFLAVLSKITAPLKLHCIAIEGQENSLAADTLAASAKNLGLNAQAHASLGDALAEIGDAPVRIVISGSLYLAGQVLADNF